MRLVVLAKDGVAEVSPKNSLVIDEPSEILLKSAVVYWNYDNIDNNTDNYLYIDGKKSFFDYGYWTFGSIKAKLKEKGVNLTAHTETGKCEIGSDKHLRLKTFGTLLGFKEDVTVQAGSTKVSSKMVNINQGLRDIRVSCNAVDKSKNIDQDGNYSNIIASIPLPMDKQIKGTLSHYNDINSKVELNKGSYNFLKFNISNNTGNGRNIGDVLLEFYITPK